MLVFCWFDVKRICLPVEVWTNCAKPGTAILWTESPCLTVTVCVVSRWMPSLRLAFPTVILCAFVPVVVDVTVVLCGLCPSVATGIAVLQKFIFNILYCKLCMKQIYVRISHLYVCMYITMDKFAVYIKINMTIFPIFQTYFQQNI